MSERIEIFYVWVIPDLELVLVEDRGSPPVNATESKIFGTWEQARDYGDARAKELYYRVEYDNEAGRFSEWLSQHPEAN